MGQRVSRGGDVGGGGPIGADGKYTMNLSVPGAGQSVAQMTIDLYFPSDEEVARNPEEVERRFPNTVASLVHEVKSKYSLFMPKADRWFLQEITSKNVMPDNTPLWEVARQASIQGTQLGFRLVGMRYEGDDDDGDADLARYHPHSRQDQQLHERQRPIRQAPQSSALSPPPSLPSRQRHQQQPQQQQQLQRRRRPQPERGVRPPTHRDRRVFDDGPEGEDEPEWDAAASSALTDELGMGGAVGGGGGRGMGRRYRDKIFDDEPETV